MADSFDPYYKWLGIAAEEQPATHYRLLGLRPLEADLDVIESAADRQMVHVRSYQSGKHGALSQKLLNEISAARACLLDPRKKAEYDAGLKKALAAREAAETAAVVPLPQARPLSSKAAGSTAIRKAVPERKVPAAALPTISVGPAAAPKAATAHPKAEKSPVVFLSAVLGGGALAIAVLAGVLVLMLGGGNSDATNGHDKTGVAATPAQGELEVVWNTTDLSDVVLFIDGSRVPISLGPVFRQMLAAGTHAVRVQRPGHGPFQSRAVVQSGQRASVVVEWRPLGGVKGAAVDLLALVDVPAQGASVERRSEGLAILQRPGNSSMVWVPYAAPREYDLRLTVERTAGDNSFFLGFLGEGYPVCLDLDKNYNRGGPKSGLSLWRGKYGDWGDNLTHYNSGDYVLPAGQKREIECQVRRDHLKVSVAGTTIIDKPLTYGDCEVVGVFAQPTRDRLTLAGWESGFTISRFELVPITTEPHPPIAAATGTPLDLLALIDVAQDSKKGAWTKTAEGLVSSKAQPAILDIPVTPPVEYDLHATALRKAGDDSLEIGLVRGNKQFAVALDNTKSFAGLDRFAGKRPNDAGNPTTRQGVVFTAGKTVNFVVRVRRSRLALAVDGTEFFDVLAGGGANLDLNHDWKGADPTHLFVGTWASEYQISSLKLVPVGAWTPPARSDKLPVPAPAAGGPWQDEIAAGRKAREVRPTTEAVRTRITQLAELNTRPQIDDLLAQSRAADIDPLQAYALRQWAAELAIQRQDLNRVWRAIDALAEHYEVDGQALRESTLQAMVAAKEFSPQNLTQWIADADTLLDKRLAADEFDMAASFTARLLEISKQKQLPKATSSALLLQKKVAKAAQPWLDFQAAQKTLAADPSDPAANLTAGRWLCFRKQDWPVGLPHLASCGDAGLRALAQAESELPSTLDGQKKLGDAWWDYAQKGAGEAKMASLARAGHWYLRAKEQTTEILAQQVLDKRLSEIAKSTGSAVSAPTPKPPEFVSLTTLAPLESPKVGWGEFVVNGGADLGYMRPLLALESKLCDEFIYAHAYSRVEFDIPAGAKSFSATCLCLASGSVKFIIEADGARLAEKERITLGQMKVDLPAGARRLALVCDSLGDIKYDRSMWCYPRFHTAVASAVTDEFTEFNERIRSKVVRAVDLSLLNPKAEADPVSVNTLTNPAVIHPLHHSHLVPCEESLFAHPPSLVTYALPAGAKAFTAIGYCVVSADVKYRVLLDNQLAYESPKVGIVPIRVAIPPGAKNITLQIDDLGTSGYDVAFWCFPRIEK